MNGIINSILANIDWDDIGDMATELLENGASEDEVVDALVHLVDIATPLESLPVSVGPVPIGPVAELLADFVAPFVIRPIVRSLMNGDAREARKAQRAHVFSARKAARAGRRAIRESAKVARLAKRVGPKG